MNENILEEKPVKHNGEPIHDEFSADGLPKGKAQNPDEKPYCFIQQTIRRKPFDYGRAMRIFFLVLICAAAAGTVGAFSFAACLPHAEKLMGIRRERVRIAGDSTSESVLSASQAGEASGSVQDDSDGSGSVQSSDSDTNTGNTKIGDTADDTNAAAQTSHTSGRGNTVAGSSQNNGQNPNGDSKYPQNPGTDPSNNSGEFKGISPEAYQELYREMIRAASDAEQAIVRVTAASSMMDYFDRTYVSQHQGTGIIAAETSTNLYILVQDPDIREAGTIQLTFCDDSIAEGTFIRQDPETNLAVVTVSTESLEEETLKEIKTVPLGNSYAMSKGDPILAVGSPMGYSDSVVMGTITSTTNSISLTDREYRILTTDITAGEKSSGVLVNLDGEVIGFIIQGLNDSNSQTVTGLNTSRITDLVENLSNAKGIPYIGIRGADVTKELSEETGVPVGLMVIGVEADSPAMLAGLKEGDIINRMGDYPIAGMTNYMTTLARLEKGAVVKVKAMRKGSSGFEEVVFDCTVALR